MFHTQKERKQPFWDLGATCLENQSSPLICAKNYSVNISEGKVN